jgi:hypothetical protein
VPGTFFQTAANTEERAWHRTSGRTGEPIWSVSEDRYRDVLVEPAEPK